METQNTALRLNAELSYKSFDSIYETKDYSLFKRINGNREPNRAHIARLLESFKTNYLIAPIIVNQHFEIIDGQHRFEAAKQLEKTIYFIIIENYGLPQIQVYNSNMDTWKKKDFLESYCQLGLKPYLLFRQFLQDFPELHMSSCGLIVLNKSSTNNKSTNKNVNSFFVKDFQNGDLVIKDIDLSYKIAGQIMDFKPHYSGFCRRPFVSAMISILKHKNYDHEIMMKKLNSCPIRLQHRTNNTEYTALIEEIYNWRNRNQVSLKYQQ